MRRSEAHQSASLRRAGLEVDLHGELEQPCGQDACGVQPGAAIPAIQSLDVVGIEQIVDFEPRLEPNVARIDVRRDTPVHLRLAILELVVVRVEKHVHAGATPRPGPGATRGQVAPQ